ncbi:MAG: iron chelate uptake ABC transporter family permease subunit, partial [Candidatus Eisenbacteria bacterium]
MQLLHLMSAPFAASVVLVLIHAYLGGHVLRRGVIFVDLAMAQFAAMGGAAALLFGFEHGTAAGYAMGLGAALVAAALFSWSRRRIHTVPQEAIIGIAYVVASSAVIIIADHVPHGAEHIKHSLVGNILWVGWRDVVKTGVIYGVLGILLGASHKRLDLVSRDPEAARARGLSLFWWDFLFYGVFAFVVTSSVQIAGVLLVFTILIVPSVFAAFAGAGEARRLPTAWAFGIVTSLAGML